MVVEQIHREDAFGRWSVVCSTKAASSLGRSGTGDPGTFWRIRNVAYLFLNDGHVGHRRRRRGRAVGSRPARTRRALHEVRQSLRRLSAPVRLLLQALPDAAGRRQEGTRQDGAAMRRLRRVLQDVFNPVRPGEPPRSPHAGGVRGDPSRRLDLAARYGVAYSLDWVAGLISRYNLKLLGH